MPSAWLCLGIATSLLVGVAVRSRQAQRVKRSKRNLCVYCGSRSGNDPAYVEAATRVGRELARRGIGLVYGGGALGLMGAVAHAVHDNGGEVISVIPRPLMKFTK